MGIRDALGRWWYGSDCWDHIQEVEAAIIEMQDDLRRINAVIKRLGG